MAIEEKPSRNEDEYFVKQDAELMRARREALEAEQQQQQRSLHFMKCPKCGGDLAERDMHGVKADVCGDCHGVWLDAGELDRVRESRQSGIQRFVSDLFGTDR